MYIHLRLYHHTVDMSEEFLDETWSLYFHDPDNSSWTKDSYNVIATVSTPTEWVQVDKAFKELWQKGMFFLMREHILPLWEDPCNTKGGCFSFKVNKPEAMEYWFKLGAKMLGSELGKKDEVMENVCGISISPKRNYCIMRIWISNNAFNDISMYNIDIPEYTQVMYKEHVANCDFNASEKS